MNKSKIQAIFFKSIVYSAMILTVSILVLIIGYILMKGIPYLSFDMFSFKYTSDNYSVIPAIINTISLTFISLLIAVPLGVFSAVYLVEYAKRDNKLIAVARMATETLSGIPSIIYGLFGYLMFVIYFGWGYSLLAGALTLAIMVLPIVMRTTEEALLSVPESYREGSFGLGAGKLRTVFKIILPSSMPGILSGIILSIGRIVGETAALIYTAGTVAQIPDNVMSSGRTLSIHMYALWKEGLAQGKAYATSVILLIVVIGINALSSLIAKKIGKGE